MKTYIRFKNYEITFFSSHLTLSFFFRCSVWVRNFSKLRAVRRPVPFPQLPRALQTRNQLYFVHIYWWRQRNCGNQVCRYGSQIADIYKTKWDGVSISFFFERGFGKIILYWYHEGDLILNTILRNPELSHFICKFQNFLVRNYKAQSFDYMVCNIM